MSDNRNSEQGQGNLCLQNGLAPCRCHALEFSERQQNVCCMQKKLSS